MQNVKRYLFITGIAVLLIVIGGLTVAAIFHVLLAVLYVFLIVLAALLVIATMFQIYSIIALLRAITTVRNEMKPLLASVQETVSIVKDTAKTAGHAASTIGSTAQLTKEITLVPGIRAAAAVVAGQQMVRVFFGKGHVVQRAEQRRKQQMEAMAAITKGE